MDDPKGRSPPSPHSIASYHAHIYYDPASTRQQAAELRAAIGERFLVQVGRWHDALVGPHTRSMYQVAFATEYFASFVPWLMLNRRGLTVLVHPNTGMPRDDHLVHSLWLGEVLPINAGPLPLREDPAAMEPVVPNTQPTRA